jgi:hypothetical protein
MFKYIVSGIWFTLALLCLISIHTDDKFTILRGIIIDYTSHQTYCYDNYLYDCYNNNIVLQLDNGTLIAYERKTTTDLKLKHGIQYEVKYCGSTNCISDGEQFSLNFKRVSFAIILAITGALTIIIFPF